MYIADAASRTGSALLREPRYTAPSSGFGNNGVLILTVAIFDASGQKFTPG